MIIWLDATEPAPNGYRWAKSVNEAKSIVESQEKFFKVTGGKPYYKIEMIDSSFNAGRFVKDGGHFIEFFKWLEETKREYPIRIHTLNFEEAESIREIINRNGWTEINDNNLYTSQSYQTRKCIYVFPTPHNTYNVVNYDVTNKDLNQFLSLFDIFNNKGYLKVNDDDKVTQEIWFETSKSFGEALECDESDIYIAVKRLGVEIKVEWSYKIN